MDIRIEQMEQQIFEALEAADAEMERRCGDRFQLHPARLPNGEAAKRQYDGLFAFSASFTAGFGSKYGAGYALELRMVTLDAVPPSFREEFEHDAIEVIQKELDKRLPERKLQVVKDVNGYKIIGDLSIGEA